jgi:hypothetical protein
MAEEDRTFDPTTPQVNRGREQGLGMGQKELDRQRDPSGETTAVDPERTQPFDTDVEAGPGEPLDDRNAAGLGGAEPLGEGTPANVDIHDTGEPDNPEDDWGAAVDEGALHGANHTRRPVKTEAERGQGPRTRQANKDIVSRRL